MSKITNSASLIALVVLINHSLLVKIIQTVVARVECLATTRTFYKLNYLHQITLDD